MKNEKAAATGTNQRGDDDDGRDSTRGQTAWSVT